MTVLLDCMEILTYFRLPIKLVNLIKATMADIGTHLEPTDEFVRDNAGTETG